MRDTLSKYLAETVNSYTKKKDPKAITEWVESHLGQLIITASQIIWTADCEEILKSMKDSEKPDKGKLWKGLRD